MVQETQKEIPPVQEVKPDEQHTEAGQPPPAEEAPLYIGKTRNYVPGVLKWRKRCKACDFFYIHDEASWCSIKKCPQKCPPKLRPLYRPKVEAAPEDNVKQADAHEGRHLYSEDNRADIYHDLDIMPREEVEAKWGLSKRSLGQLIRKRKDKKAHAGEGSRVPWPSEEEYPLMEKARIEVRYAYLQGWKDGAEFAWNKVERRS